MLQSLQGDLGAAQRSLSALESAVSQRQSALWGEQTRRHQQQRQLALAREYQASFYRLQP